MHRRTRTRAYNKGSRGPARSVHAGTLRCGRWRYRLVVGLIWWRCFAAAAAGWRYARTSGPAYGPVIVISIESLRADRLPVYGYTRVRTPAIDALAADSVTFDRAYAHSPLTLPSHVSMLSGLLPFQTGVRDEVGFPIRARTLAAPAAAPPARLQDRGRGLELPAEEGDGPRAGVRLLRRRPGAGSGEADRPASADSAETLKVAEHWIDSIGTSRFFLFLHLDGIGPAAAMPGRPANLSPYDARIAYADELVGRLVAFLKKRGLYNGGIIVLTSDHGQSLGDHGEQGHGLLLYEAAVRTPLIIKLPRRDGGGRHSTALVQHIDIAPTILDLIGAPTPSALAGVRCAACSIRRRRPSPIGRSTPSRWRPATCSAGARCQSLTDGRYRYISSAAAGAVRRARRTRRSARTWPTPTRRPQSRCARRSRR